MAFVHGKNAQVIINSKDISTFCDTAEVSFSGDTADVTSFGASYKAEIPGLKGVSFTVGGSYDPTAVSGPNAALLAAFASATSVAFTIGPGGSAAGQVKYTGNLIVTDYSESSSVGSQVKFTSKAISDGLVTVGSY